jgi:hypothetical protein
MDHEYVVRYYFKNRPQESEPAKTLEEARSKASKRLRDDPECCANIIIAEFEPETPNKRLVSMERYEIRGEEVTRLPNY